MIKNRLSNIYNSLVKQFEHLVTSQDIAWQAEESKFFCVLKKPQNVSKKQAENTSPAIFCDVAKR